MAKILVVDDERDTRDLLVDILADAGCDVIEAKNGSVALDKVHDEPPDLILLDIMMPNMDGFEVLGKLREDPETAAIPVVLISAVPASKGELIGWRLGVKHYITKPFDGDRVRLAVKVALREAVDAETEEVGEYSTSAVWRGSKRAQKSSHGSGAESAIRSGNRSLDDILSGGIPLGSLSLIEGTPSSGKSVLCQHFAFGSLQDGHAVIYFTSNNTANGVVMQMNSVGLHASKYRRVDRLHIAPLQAPSSDDECDFVEDSELSMVSLTRQIERFPSQYQVILVDSITELITYGQDKAVLRFLSSCKRLCDQGRTIVLATQSYALDEQMRLRVRDLCDTHLSLRVENYRSKSATTLEVTKSRNVDLSDRNTVSFEVEPGVGMKNLPFSKVKA